MTRQKQLCGSQSPIRVANIGADKIMFCITVRGRFSKTLIFQAITSVDLSSGSNFTKGNDSLLSAFLRFSFVQEEGCLLRIPSPTNREWRKRLTPCHRPNAMQIRREGQCCGLYLIHSKHIQKYSYCYQTHFHPEDVEMGRT